MTTSYDVARSFLRMIGAPVTDSMTRAVAIWIRFESGGTIRGNNPWNLHSGDACPADKGYCPGEGNLPGQIGNRYAGPGDRNVAVFATLDDGIRASVVNLTRRPPGDWTGYDLVVKALREGRAVGFLTALQNSKWSAGHYSYSKLVNAFSSSLNYNQTIKFVNYGGGSDNTTTERDKIESGGKYKEPASIGDVIEGAANVFGFLLDAENWLYMIALAGGGILLAYGAKQIIASTGTTPTIKIAEGTT